MPFDYMIATGIGTCFIAEIGYVIAMIIAKKFNPWYIFSIAGILQIAIIIIFYINEPVTSSFRVSLFISIFWLAIITIICFIVCKKLHNKRDKKAHDKV